MKRGVLRKDYEVSNRFEIVHAGKFPHACVRTGRAGAPLTMPIHPTCPLAVFSGEHKYTQTFDKKNIPQESHDSKSDATAKYLICEISFHQPCLWEEGGC